jgi:hypothetical protein
MVKIILVVIAVLLLSTEVASFLAPVKCLSTGENQLISIGASTSKSGRDVEESGQATLTFNCDSAFTSEPVPGATPQEIFAFFEQPAQRNCMISAGNIREVHDVDDEGYLLELWKQRSLETGACEPDASDSVLRVITGGMNFPGLSLTSEAYIGAKLLEPQSNSVYPVYEFTLIKDAQQVTGFKPAVWIFNQLTGANGDATKDKNKAQTLSKVTAGTTEDGQTVFQVLVKFAITVSFPKVLLRILPVSKEKAEEQGSDAIGKTLEKDLQNAIKTLRQQYLDQRV